MMLLNILLRRAGMSDWEGKHRIYMALAEGGTGCVSAAQTTRLQFESCRYCDWRVIRRIRIFDEDQSGEESARGVALALLRLSQSG